MPSLYYFYQMRSFFLYILFMSCFVLAQEPAHEVINDEQLEGLSIFSILQDERANIWLSTNDGLFRYNGYDLKSYSSDRIISTGLFGLVQDHNHQIYCYNTFGQIFRIEDDSLSLFYTIPNTLFQNFFYLEFDNLNRLIISGKGIYSIDRNKEIKSLMSHSSLIATPLVRKPKGILEFYSSNGHDLYTLYNGQLKKANTQINFGDGNFYYPFYSSTNEYLGVGHSSTIYKRRGQRFDQVNHGIVLASGCRVLADQQDNLWFLRNQRGLYLISKNKALSQYHNRLLFSSYTISSQLEDRDGNIWLGTFGKGLIKISNPENQVINNSTLKHNNELRGIAKDNQNHLYIGSINGKLYQYIGHKLEIIDSVSGRINRIERDHFTNTLYFNYSALTHLKGIYKQTPFGSIKDISYTSDGLTVISTYTGIYIQNQRQLNKKQSQNLTEMGFTPEGEFGYRRITGRLLCAGYDTDHQILWIGESTGLKQVKGKEEKTFKLKGNPVIALDIQWVGQQLYIASLNNGILVFENGRMIKTITKEDGLLTNAVRQLKYQNEKLYIGTKYGLQEMDLKTGVFNSFQDANGKRLNVINFEIISNKAFIIHHHGLQIIHLNEVLKQVKPPILDFTSIVVNGHEIQEPSVTLHYHQNVIQFNFAAKTYNHRKQLNYRYKLIGKDNDWHTLSYAENNLNFSGLAHGHYQLRILAIDANGQASNTITYHFTVEQPIWMAWWFYLSITVIAIALVILFYKKRLKIQEKKAQQINELNASKLTAIQSQMNPHFIFNALNSVQNLVMEGDKVNAYSMITKFANLIRKTLNYSDKDFIEFEQEIQLLELYLSLEKQRFKTDFDFKIQTNNIADILIPPMLIQPFIENALVHGLLHQTGHKQLTISFELNEYLTCSITDNGIGREQAKAIKRRQKGKHESFAVQAIKKRLQILQEKFKGNIGFGYEDLIDEGVIKGTKVTIRMPFKRLF